MTLAKNTTCFRPDWFSRRSKRRRRTLAFFGASATAALAAMGCYDGNAHAASRLQVLTSFGNLKGSTPYGALVADGAGNLYGMTKSGGANNDGVVFELSPPAVGQTAWTEKVLLSFNGTNGAAPPAATLIADSEGNLYGTTTAGGTGNGGVVFELSPPKPGKKAWAETVLFSFSGFNGDQPEAGLIADAAGNLYGTTSQGGTGYGVVFELSPPAEGQTTWTEAVLQYFNDYDGYQPQAGLIADGTGNLYGTTNQGGRYNHGTVFELSPPAAGQTAWTETLLYSFAEETGDFPYGGLIADSAGNLYGTTFDGGANYNGTVFELSPPKVGKATWKEKLLYTFNGTGGQALHCGLLADSKGNLYGTATAGGANGDGVVFELLRKDAWTEKVLYSFNGTKGSDPWAGVIADGAGNLYGTTTGGGSHEVGVAFKLTN